jgi:hypothetical protein
VWVCTHQGFPLVALPGGNVFFSNEDLTTPDGAISCKRVDPKRAVYDVVKAARYLERLVELLPFP